MLSIVTADTPNGADRDALLCPRARREGKPQNGSEDITVTRFAPHDATDLGIDIGWHEGGDGRVMTSQAEREIILELLLGCETGAQNILPVGENSQKAVGRVAHFDKAARF